MTDQRRPAAFRIDEPPPEPAPKPAGEQTPRRPRAVRADEAIVTLAPVDAFEEEYQALALPPPARPVRRRWRIASVLWTAIGALLSLAIGLWIDHLIRALFERADWLGWFAVGAVAVGVLALLALVARELAGLMRLASVERLHASGADALARNDSAAARALVGELTSFLSAKPETAAGRRMLADLEGEVIDGADLIRLAETELLAPLDRRAQKLVLDAAKRVSIVTAVSPRAVVDLAYVVFEAGRLIRRVADLYGGRPGTLGFFRLTRSVLAHLAVTGSIAMGDGIVQQIVGHGLAARLSARLGEGVVNGMMTARIGMAAMEAARPLPFSAVKRPGMGDILNVLTRFNAERNGRAKTDSFTG
jgi:putative membrane protein